MVFSYQIDDVERLRAICNGLQEGDTTKRLTVRFDPID